MAGGPSDDVKRLSAQTDRSHDLVDGWGHILKNLTVVALVAAAVWCLVTLVRVCIAAASETIFGGFRSRRRRRQGR